MSDDVVLIPTTSSAEFKHQREKSRSISVRSRNKSMSQRKPVKKIKKIKHARSYISPSLVTDVEPMKKTLIINRETESTPTVIKEIHHYYHKEEKKCASSESSCSSDGYCHKICYDDLGYPISHCHSSLSHGHSHHRVPYGGIPSFIGPPIVPVYDSVRFIPPHIRSFMGPLCSPLLPIIEEVHPHLDFLPLGGPIEPPFEC